MTSDIKVVVADDHQIIRDGLCQLLNDQANMKVIGKATDGVDALSMAKRLRPDVMVLDIAMPNMNGLEAVELIHGSVPEIKIVIHSMYEKEAYTHQAFSAGAMGYVLKAAPSTDIINAIRTVARDEYFMSSKMRTEVIGNYLKNHKETATESRYEQLSSREKQVFLLLVEGNSNDYISDVLCISPKTVEKHRANISKKIGTKNLVQMVKYALRVGVISAEFWEN